jgi:hypothetical protein
VLQNQQGLIMSVKFLAKTIFIITLVFSQHAHAQSNASEASVFSGVGLSFVAGSVLVGTIQDLAKISSATVSSVALAGESIVLALKDASGAMVGSIQVSAKVTGAASIGVGSAIRFVTESVGYAIYAGSQLIAFIPNELGNSLIYRGKVNQ